MVPTARIYSIQFGFWLLHLYQHLHPHLTCHLSSKTYPLPRRFALARISTLVRPVLGAWWRWALDGVAPSRMVCVSASVNLPLHHKVQKFSSDTGSPGGPRKRAIKQLCVCATCTSYRVRATSTLCVKKTRHYNIVHNFAKC